MSNITNQTEKNSEESETQETKIVGKKVVESREDKIRKYREGSEQFNKDTSRNVEILPNVKFTVLFFEDWYLDWDEVYHEALTVKHYDEAHAIRYADEHYRVRKSLRDSTEKAGEQYSEHKFLVTEPNCGFPEMVKELRLSSKKAIKQINDALAEVALEHEGRIIMSILKKQGKTQYQVEWEIEASPFT